MACKKETKNNNYICFHKLLYFLNFLFLISISLVLHRMCVCSCNHPSLSNIVSFFTYCIYYLFFSFFLLNIVLLFPWFYWLYCVVMITLPSICMGNDKTSTPLLLVVISPYVVGQDQQQPINIIPGDSCCHRICISLYHPWIFLANFANFHLLKF